MVFQACTHVLQQAKVSDFEALCDAWLGSGSISAVQCAWPAALIDLMRQRQVPGCPLLQQNVIPLRSGPYNDNMQTVSQALFYCPPTLDLIDHGISMPDSRPVLTAGLSWILLGIL